MAYTAEYGEYAEYTYMHKWHKAEYGEHAEYAYMQSLDKWHKAEFGKLTPAFY